MAISPLRHFMLAALLWLPFAFFVWFAFAAQWVWPVVQIVKWIALHAWPNLFLDVAQGADEINTAGQLVAHHPFWLTVSTNVIYNAAGSGKPADLAYYDFPLNPMIYGYSLPLFAGLVMATPLQTRQRLIQLAAGIALLWLAQAFGVLAESFKSIGIDLPEGAAAMQRLGMPLNAIALAYQFGYLILPPLLPAVLWIVFNRRFIEELTQPGEAPSAGVPAPAEPALAAAEEPVAAPAVRLPSTGE